MHLMRVHYSVIMRDTKMIWRLYKMLYRIVDYMKRWVVVESSKKFWIRCPSALISSRTRMKSATKKCLPCFRSPMHALIFLMTWHQKCSQRMTQTMKFRRICLITYNVSLVSLPIVWVWKVPLSHGRHQRHMDWKIVNPWSVMQAWRQIRRSPSHRECTSRIIDLCWIQS